MENMTPIIKELADSLQKGNAHATYEEAVNDLPHDLLGKIPDGLPYSLWQLIEHIRITQWDILEFSNNPQHKSPPWPEGYWPKEKAPAHAGDLKKSIDQTLTDRKAFVGLLKEADDLHTPFKHGDGQTLFREALLIIDHNAYHTGEIVVLRRLLGAWPKAQH
jgi:uncharacterized damage-inducible protein DinB